MTNTDIEKFQYIYENDKIKAVPHIKIRKENIMLEVPTINTYECRELCRTTPDCRGYNYALNECTLYKNIKYEKPEYNFYRYW